MVVDTSALAAILFDEPERKIMIEVLSFANSRKIAAPNWLELCLVVDNRGNAYATARLESALGRLRIEVAPFDRSLAETAREAHRQYGRGRHAAKLNFGDCVGYALAKTLNEPLLFKGNDFAQTDITPALAA